MIDLQRKSNTPGLLVSVRSVDEALTALAGGADVIDVKEPDRGSLGAAEMTTIAAIARAVGDRARVTAAMGELVEIAAAAQFAALAPVPAGVSLFKLGLAGCASRANWQSELREAVERISGSDTRDCMAVAVAYADWRTAGAPSPDDILELAIELGCPALLIDTWSKKHGDLFAHWPAEQLEPFVERVRSQRIAIVLAGALAGESIAKAAQLGADIVAVRGAACVQGRSGRVDLERVRELKRIIASAVVATTCAADRGE